MGDLPLFAYSKMSRESSTLRTTLLDTYSQGLSERRLHYSRQGKDGRTQVLCMDHRGVSHGECLMPNFFGVPQRRKRVFLVASAGDLDPSEILFESEGVCWDSAPSREKRKGPASPAEGGVGGGLFRLQAFGQYTESPTASTLKARDYKDATDLALAQRGDNQPAVCIAGNIIGRKPENGGNGVGAQEGVCYTLTTNDKHAVATGSIVRRLTPKEYERLQGFPDDYTKISWRGKPASDCPDGHRYKALGDSWAVNVARWVGRRIELVEAERAKEGGNA